jgi:hypothetical protein
MNALMGPIRQFFLEKWKAQNDYPRWPIGKEEKPAAPKNFTNSRLTKPSQTR